MKDPESLRQIYNERYSTGGSRWTTEDPVRCAETVRWVIRRAGITRQNGLTVLDVGCGTGYYTSAFSKAGFKATGLDYSEVAIAKSKTIHKDCDFIHGDGFNPPSDKFYDLVFCRGFSGANTHDLQFVAEWINKYIQILNPGGVVVLSYSTDLSGKEAENETVNWTLEEMTSLSKRVKAGLTSMSFYYRKGILSRSYNLLRTMLRGKRNKEYFYMMFSKEK
ncbi:MAG: class I SAM-dependent methyltransferase [Bacteroidales bacterium]